MAKRLSISNTFVVATIDDPVSIMAQYAPNNNPTASQIHNTWISGDKYMRTKTTDEINWSDWMKIVGENGDETNFSFAISSYTVPSQNGYPQDLDANDSTWSDAPVATTTQRPYLWARVQKKEWSEAQQSYIVSDTSYIRITGEKGDDGTSPYFADISNEMNGISCTSAGVTKAATGNYQSVSTRVSLWKGASSLSISTLSCSVTDGTNTQSISSSYGSGTLNKYFKFSSGNDEPRTLTVDIKDGYTMSAGKVEIIIIIKNTTENIEKELRLVLVAAKAGESGEPATIYGLVPSVNDIVKKKNGDYVPSGNTYITCSVTKTTGTTTTPALSGFELYYSLNGGTEQSYSGTSIKSSNVTSNVVFSLYVPSKTLGTLVDRETIPLVTDGTDGGSPVFLDLDNEMGGVACDATGRTEAEQEVSTNIHMWLGLTPMSINTVECTITQGGSTQAISTEYASSKSAGVSYWAKMNYSNGKLTIKVRENTVFSSSETPYPTGDFVEINVIVTSGAGLNAIQRNSTLTISAVYAGSNGEPATLYNLMPSPSSINVQRGNNDTYIPQLNTLICGYTKNVGGLASSANEASGNIDDIYRIFFRRKARNGDWETTYYYYNNVQYKRLIVVTTGYPTSGLDVSIYDKVEFILYKNTTSDYISQANIDSAKIIDKETVPVISDGKKGDKGESVIYEIRSTVDSLVIPVGQQQATLNTTLSFWKIEDKVATAYQCNFAIYTRQGQVYTYANVSGENESEFNTSGEGVMATRSMDAIVIFISDDDIGGNSVPTSFLAKKEILVNQIVKGEDSTEYKLSIIDSTFVLDKKTNMLTENISGNILKIVGDSYSALSDSQRTAASLSVYINFITPSGNIYDNDVWQVTYNVNNPLFSDDAYTSTYINGELAQCVVSLMKNNTLIDTYVIPISMTNVDGARGKAGRFYYYAGEWSSLVTYVMNDTQSPYVKASNGLFYMLTNDANSGVNVSSTNQNPTSSSYNNGKPWTVMESDQKYYIAEAYFGAFAHFGGSIINGDWLMSQYGYMLGFGNTRNLIYDGSQYQNTDTDDVLGEDDMYDSEKLLLDGVSANIDVTSIYYVTIGSVVGLSQGKYYTLQIDENTGLIGSELSVTVVSQSGTVALEKQIETSGDNKIHSYYWNFICTASTVYSLRVKVKSNGQQCHIVNYYLRECKFVPYLAIDMLAGKLVANNIIARGELHADSLYNANILSNNNNDVIRVNDESIVALGTAAVGVKVILPAPSACKGRKIEIYSIIQPSYDWSVTWEGASNYSYFYSMPMTTNASNYTALRAVSVSFAGTSYILFYSNGTRWIILKQESVEIMDGRRYVLNSLFP